MPLATTTDPLADAPHDEPAPRSCDACGDSHARDALFILRHVDGREEILCRADAADAALSLIESHLTVRFDTAGAGYIMVVEAVR